jgi:hypothetical protein
VVAEDFPQLALQVLVVLDLLEGRVEVEEEPLDLLEVLPVLVA